MAGSPFDAVKDQLPKAMREWLQGSVVTDAGDHLNVTPGQVLTDKEQSLLSDRLGRLLGRRVDFSFPDSVTPADEERRTQTTESAEPEPHDQCPVCDSAVEELNQAQAASARINEELVAAKAMVHEFEQNLATAETDLRGTSQDSQTVGEVRDSLATWIAARRDTFAWRLFLALGAEQDKATNDTEDSRRWLAQGIANFRPMQTEAAKPGRFLVPIMASTVAIITAVIALLALSRTGIASMLVLPDQKWIVGVGVLLWLAVVLRRWFAYERADAARILSERGTNNEQQSIQSRIQVDRGYHGLMYLDFSRGLLMPIPWLILLALAVNWMGYALPLWIASYIPAPWIIWTTAALLYVIIVIGVTYRYYAGVSRLRGELKRLQRLATEHRERYLHAAREEARLKSLRRSVPEYLEAVALPLHAPWLVDDSVVLDGGAHPDVERFPACVGLAYASGTLTHERPRMRVLSRAALVAPGWLNTAVNEVVREVGVRSGAALTLDSLDRDPGDSPSGARRQVIDKAGDSELLAHLGRQRLRDLAAKVQIAAVKEVKPEVRPLRDAGLGRLVSGTTRLLDEGRTTVPWSEFLQGALAPAAPFSLLTFTETSRSESPQRIARSLAIVPHDLESRAESSGFEVITTEDDGSAPLDLVVRIDRSEWLEPRVLTIFDGVTPVPVDREVGSVLEGHSGPAGL